MKMKKVLALAMTACMVALVGCTQSTSQVISKTEDAGADVVEAKEIMIVGLDDQFPPMGFRDDKGNIVGFDVDLAKEVAKRIDKQVEFVPIVWETKETILDQKEIDMIWNGYTITPAREEMVLFSDSYLANSQIIIVREDSGITSIADLAGKVVGLQLGSSAQDAVEKNQDALNSFKELKKYDDNLLVLMDLQLGGIDAAVMDSVLGNYQIKMHDYPFTVLAEDFGAEEYGIGMRKTDTVTAEKINTALKEMKEDGAYEAIYSQWFAN